MALLGPPIKMRVKNTFLEVDVPCLDLRRLESCPGRMYVEAQFKSWADYECDSDSGATPMEPEEEPRTRVISADSVDYLSCDTMPRTPLMRPEWAFTTPKKACLGSTGHGSTRKKDRKRSESMRVEKLFWGRETSNLPGSFPVVRRVIGPAGKNLRNLAEKFGCVVSLRGRGCEGSGTKSSETEPLHLLIKARGEVMPDVIREALEIFEGVGRQQAMFDKRPPVKRQHQRFAPAPLEQERFDHGRADEAGRQYQCFAS